MDIKVVGNSSSNRMKLIKNIIKALKELEIHAIPKILDDEKQLKKYKNQNTPILIINDKIVSEGKILETREIKKFIKILN